MVTERRDRLCHGSIREQSAMHPGLIRSLWPGSVQPATYWDYRV